MKKVTTGFQVRTGHSRLLIAPLERYVILLSIVVIGSLATAQEIDHALWQERLLVLIAPSADDPALIRQKQALRDADDAVSERRLRVVELYLEPDGTDTMQLEPAHQRAIRKSLGVESGDRQLVLIGLDGDINSVHRWRHRCARFCSRSMACLCVAKKSKSEDVPDSL